MASGDPSDAVARLYRETIPDGDDRTHFQRDRDIIVYTSALQRLSGITQVASAYTGHVFHNRLTHTLQVAQVGRRLAEKLHLKQPDLARAVPGGLSPDAVEAVCLAHDLGHPPFGHVAESVLNRLCGDGVEGFEGNAQSFRIVSGLAFRAPEFSGLNLTRATLAGILKYPWTFAKKPKPEKWGAYQSEIDSFAFATGDASGGPIQRTAEAELMDWSDDLTYSVHDVEDFYRAGLIPLHLLRPPRGHGQPDYERRTFLEYVWERRAKIPELSKISQSQLDEIFGDVIFSNFTVEGAYEGRREQRARLRKFTSRLVGRYINGLHLAEPGGDSTVRVDDDTRQEIAILKQLTWFYVIEAASLAVQQHAQKQIIRYLFGVFRNEAKRVRPSNILPAYYRQRLAQAAATEGPGGPSSTRAVVDLIAGMTESQAISLYKRLNGIIDASALDRALI